MKAALILLASLVSPLLATAAAPAQSWLCIADKATGFIYERGQWVSADFKPEKFVLKRAPYFDCSDVKVENCKTTEAYQWISFGSESGEPCSFHEETIVCGTAFSRTFLYRKTLRFSHFYFVGYIDGDKGGDTPSVTIGKCTTL